MLVAPRLRSALTAVSSGWPSTSGTTTVPSPFETVTSTSEPFFTSLPPAGFCSITWPSGRSESSSSTLKRRPASSICVLASVSARPTTSGTVESLRSLRDQDRDLRLALDLLAWRGLGVDDVSGLDAVRVHLFGADLEVLVLKLLGRIGGRLVDHALRRNRDLLPERDADLDLGALVRALTGGRVRLGDGVRLVAALEVGGHHLESLRLKLVRGDLAVLPDHRRHQHLLRAGEREDDARDDQQRRGSRGRSISSGCPPPRAPEGDRRRA